ncbi:MAG: serine/threonine protein kinase [Myxococcota bacterium]|nr:serine/threonine protein kinase [Myxococcota bacterium]
MGGSRPASLSTSEVGTAPAMLGDTSFGKYTLIAKIGHGGMAEVFLAAVRGPAGFTKLCVLKRLHPHLEEEDALVGMFLDEARLAARLNHPNVVQTYEVGDVEGLHFLTMEYLEGQSLARVLRHLRRLDQPLPLGVGTRMFVELLDGLQYAHSLKDFDGTPLNVVHRDISPGNVYVTYDGQVKLLDFGIARAGTQLVETRAGQVKGKFAYIAPEQASTDGKHDQRADIWSLGVVMWEAFAGKRLFKGDSEVATLHNALTSEILTLDTEIDVPNELARIVDRALQRDPDARYPSARAMKEDLEQFMHSEGLRAGRNDVGSFVTELFERERDDQRRVLSAYMRGESPGISMTPISISGGTGSGVSSRSSMPSAASAVVATDGSRDKKKQMLVVGLLLLLAAGVGAFFALSGGADDPVADAGTVGANANGAGNTGTPIAGTGTADPNAAANAAGATNGTTGTTGTTDTENAGANVPSLPDPVTSMAEPPAMVEALTAMDTSAMSERPRNPSAMRPRTTPVEATTPPPRMEESPPPPAAEDGFLTLDTIPWSNVALGNRRLGTTPLIRFRLPPGEHNLTLTNPEQGIRSTYRVVVQPGQTTARRIAIQ